VAAVAAAFGLGNTNPAAPPGGARTAGLVGAIVELMVDWLVDSTGDDIEGLLDDLELYCRVMLAGIEATWPLDAEHRP
jgi:hypothetical protein